jgi:dienelactone hydrolase
MPRSAKGTLIVVLLLLLLAGWTAWPSVRAAAFVMRAAGMDGRFGRAIQWTSAVDVDERELAIPWRGGDLRARAYLPRAESDGAVLIVPGVHASGIDEPRLDGVARDLAAMKRIVVAVELPPLMRYRIVPELTDMIEDAAAWVASQPTLAGHDPIGLAGISFAGGLSLVAASRPSVRDRISFVLSFGGHGDLPRTLEYLCTGVQPDGSHLPPHDYGVAIILLGVADRVVPADQVEPLRAGILTFLEGSRLDMVDRDAAAREFAQARRMVEALPGPAASLLRAVNDRDVAALGPILLPHVHDFAADPALSPARAPAPAGVVYLLHGAGDTVIPTVESALLAEDLRSRGVRVRHLATPLITHTHVENGAAIQDVWRLVRFWAALLGE